MQNWLTLAEDDFVVRFSSCPPELRMTDRFAQLESILATRLRHVEESSVAGSDDDRTRLQRDAASIVARLLGEHLRTREEWGASRWIDDMLLDDIRRDATRWILEGRAVWGVTSGSTRQWVEPLQAQIEVADDRSIRDYRLFFASASRGLGRSEYGEGCLPLLDGDTWLFVFDKRDF